MEGRRSRERTFWNAHAAICSLEQKVITTVGQYAACWYYDIWGSLHLYIYDGIPSQFHDLWCIYVSFCIFGEWTISVMCLNSIPSLPGLRIPTVVTQAAAVATKFSSWSYLRRTKALEISKITKFNRIYSFEHEKAWVPVSDALQWVSLLVIHILLIIHSNILCS